MPITVRHTYSLYVKRGNISADFSFPFSLYCVRTQTWRSEELKRVTIIMVSVPNVSYTAFSYHKSARTNAPRDKLP